MTRKRKLAIGGGAAVALVAVAGLLHVPALRGLFGGCPWEASFSASQLEDLRRKSAASIAEGRSERAPSRPALGFALWTTTRKDVSAWATAHADRLSCKEELGGGALRCEKAEGEPGEVQDAFFRFEPGGTLVAVDVVYGAMTPEAATEKVTTTTTTLSRTLGAPAATPGEWPPTAAYLGGGRHRRSAAEFRFSDYAADVSATAFDEGLVTVREQYRALDQRAEAEAEDKR